MVPYVLLIVGDCIGTCNTRLICKIQLSKYFFMQCDFIKSYSFICRNVLSQLAVIIHNIYFKFYNKLTTFRYMALFAQVFRFLWVRYKSYGCL